MTAPLAALLAPSDGWAIYTQHALKIGVCVTNTTSEPRPLLELRHAKTGATERGKDGLPRALAPGESRWVVLEPCDPVAPAYAIDSHGAVATAPSSDAAVHPGGAVYSKPLADADAHWVDVTFERDARLAALRAHGLVVPTRLLALTMRSLGLSDVPEDDDALLADSRVHLFRSRTRVLGRRATAHATLRLASRDEDLAPGDLLVVELTKTGVPLALAAPLLVRRIDAPALRGALWAAVPDRAGVVGALLSEARHSAAPPPSPPKWQRALAHCLRVGA